MKRFRFELEQVLELRQFREEQTRIDLGQAVGALSAIENEIKSMAQARVTATRQRFSGVASGIGNDPQKAALPNSQPDMLVWDNYIARLEQETERLLKKAAEAELVVEEKRNIYMKASSELKVMEKLKEEEKKKYRKEALSAETRTLDDMRRVSSE